MQTQKSKSDATKALSFVLDKNLGLPLTETPWSEIVAKNGMKITDTKNLVNIDDLLGDDAPDWAYVPGADFCKLQLQGNRDYVGLLIATSKFTQQPVQRTLMVVRKDDPATSLDDLEGATYGYMNRSCSSSFFPPAILLHAQGKDFETFLKIEEVPGWQNRVDAVVAKKIRATMILDDVWKMDPKNAETTKVVAQYDNSTPAILVHRNDAKPELIRTIREQALQWMPNWQNVYGAFRPYVFADVQMFFHDLGTLPKNVLG